MVNKKSSLYLGKINNLAKDFKLEIVGFANSYS